MKFSVAVLSTLLPLALVCSTTSFAQSGTAWDGTWKGYWRNHRLATIFVKDGSVVDYSSGGDVKQVGVTRATDATLTFGYGRASNSVSLTRTGANSAEGIRVTRFSGRIRDARSPKGYSAGSAGADFTRL
jgi:hypothetical protein